ncbi:hypothetical protein H2248_008482 [Termitomyces sp. 'cryptogamus']|nr:hypothetical protein H2248_008482 [Termitomyces sp. 'cryptogamus']
MLFEEQTSSDMDKLRDLESIPGSFEKLTDMPLELLFEVFEHLHPTDLLNLSRTTKTLRSILMKRSARSVWRSAIANVPGLPACPMDLDEPQYANLAFDDCCHFCSAPGIQDIFWNCRVRCCKNCIEANFVSDYDLNKLIPAAPGGKTKAIFPFIVYPKPRPYKPGRILYYLAVAKQYQHELGQLQTDEMTVRQWSTRKEEEQDRRLTHAALCEHWSNDHWVHKRSSEVNILMIIFLAAALAVMHQEFLSEYIF